MSLESRAALLTGLSGKPRREIVATTVGEIGEQAHEPLSNACLTNNYVGF
ncbi:MAG TPA: hypothetical protein K8W15_07910 [Gallibacterium anatis]|uniref:Uncharacterized protein n=1 Tax=Gallibacterium anatis TaxID=750 RepID=A0A921L1J7_9PAST|nr:hypothetical protein [Gallibacterium anatis]HJF74092.1 hypothetical protein [Gallibacterium anatis]